MTVSGRRVRLTRRMTPGVAAGRRAPPRPRSPPPESRRRPVDLQLRPGLERAQAVGPGREQRPTSRRRPASSVTCSFTCGVDIGPNRQYSPDTTRTPARAGSSPRRSSRSRARSRCCRSGSARRAAAGRARRRCALAIRQRGQSRSQRSSSRPRCTACRQSSIAGRAGASQRRASASGRIVPEIDLLRLQHVVGEARRARGRAASPRWPSPSAPRDPRSPGRPAAGHRRKAPAAGPGRRRLALAASSAKVRPPCQESTGEEQPAEDARRAPPRADRCRGCRRLPASARRSRRACGTGPLRKPRRCSNHCSDTQLTGRSCHSMVTGPLRRRPTKSPNRRVAGSRRSRCSALPPLR